MAFSNSEKTTVSALVAREGLDGLLDLVRQTAVADKKAAAVAALGSAVTVTVSDWKTPATFVGQATSATLPSVIADLDAAWAAKDQTHLGALYVQLHGATKAHLGL